MKHSGYRSVNEGLGLNRRQFIGLTCAGAGLLLGTPAAWAAENEKKKRPPKPATNIEDAMAVKKTRWSIPGPFPGKVVEVTDPAAMKAGKPQSDVVASMVTRGIESLTGKTLDESWPLFFEAEDVVGIKVNPVGPGLISTRHEVVDAVIDWLVKGGIKKKNIVIWDRFDYMLADAGFTSERYPGIRIVGLQTMDEQAYMGKADDSNWLKPDGTHVSTDNFDRDVYYHAEVDGPKDKQYLNQHVVNGEYSYFGKLVSRELTKIINIPVFKNTGNGISMATKNLGYGAICNTGRLHKPLFFDVCTEILAFPCIRDRLVLNITDGLRGQYDGGPMPVTKFAFERQSLHVATDPFALDAVCHDQLVAKRKEMDVRVNEHPMYTEYLRYGQKLGLGVADHDKIQHVKI